MASWPPIEVYFIDLDVSYLISLLLSFKMIMLIPIIFTFSLSLVSALKYDIQEIEYNLNQNNTASHPLEYSGEWPDHNYQTSPSNWRFPFYTLFLDRFVNGDPSNDGINGTGLSMM